jgi:hypothetical protein
MRRPGFWREVGVALALSIVGAIAYPAVAAFIGSAAALRLIIAGLGIVYAVLLMRGVKARAGRVIAIGAWFALDVVLFAYDPPLLLWLLAQSFAIWLLRCWCCYGSLLAALADSALCLFALAAAMVGAAHSHSLFLALWSFFLVQALFVLIPDTLRPRIGRVLHNHIRDNSRDEDRFDQAHRSAEAALRRLTAHP